MINIRTTNKLEKQFFKNIIEVYTKAKIREDGEIATLGVVDFALECEEDGSVQNLHLKLDRSVDPRHYIKEYLASKFQIHTEYRMKFTHDDKS